MTISAGGGFNFNPNPTPTIFQGQTSAQHELQNQGALGQGSAAQGNVVILPQSQQDNIPFTQMMNRNTWNYKAETGHPTLHPMGMMRTSGTDVTRGETWEEHFEVLKEQTGKEMQTALETLDTPEFAALRDVLRRVARFQEWQELFWIDLQKKGTEEPFFPYIENGRNLCSELFAVTKKLLHEIGVNDPHYLETKEYLTVAGTLVEATLFPYPDLPLHLEQLLSKKKPLKHYLPLEVFFFHFAKLTLFSENNKLFPSNFSLYCFHLLRENVADPLFAYFDLDAAQKLKLEYTLDTYLSLFATLIHFSNAEELVPKEEAPFDPGFRDELLLQVLFSSKLPGFVGKEFNQIDSLFPLVLLGIAFLHYGNHVKHVASLKEIVIAALEKALKKGFSPWNTLLEQLRFALLQNKNVELEKSLHEITEELLSSNEEGKLFLTSFIREYLSLTKAYIASTENKQAHMHIVG